MILQQELDKLKLRIAAIVEMLPGTMGGSYRSIDDMMQSLRVRVKYLMFDNEATRRENEYLRDMLESRWKDKPSSGDQQLT